MTPSEICAEILALRSVVTIILVKQHLGEPPDKFAQTISLYKGIVAKWMDRDGKPDLEGVSECFQLEVYQAADEIWDVAREIHRSFHSQA